MPLGLRSAAWGGRPEPELLVLSLWLLAARTRTFDLQLPASGAASSCRQEQIDWRGGWRRSCVREAHRARLGLQALHFSFRCAANAPHLGCCCPSPEQPPSERWHVWRAGGQRRAFLACPTGVLSGPPTPCLPCRRFSVVDGSLAHRCAGQGVNSFRASLQPSSRCSLHLQPKLMLQRRGDGSRRISCCALVGLSGGCRVGFEQGRVAVRARGLGLAGARLRSDSMGGLGNGGGECQDSK